MEHFNFYYAGCCLAMNTFCYDTITIAFLYYFGLQLNHIVRNYDDNTIISYETNGNSYDDSNDNSYDGATKNDKTITVTDAPDNSYNNNDNDNSDSDRSETTSAVNRIDYCVLFLVIVLLHRLLLLLCSFLSVFILRRHLMVWAVFAPKVIVTITFDYYYYCCHHNCYNYYYSCYFYVICNSQRYCNCITFTIFDTFVKYDYVFYCIINNYY